jgi:hypothetical protein
LHVKCPNQAADIYMTPLPRSCIILSLTSDLIFDHGVQVTGFWAA